ncbi:hypothetical protein A3A36_00240 [Candidatus Kaiserbacteria bacterium RIFCSPLOWO2_01_FULL_52_12b]|uniref:Uncharacterized protein n=1 Tax=Candidatus Kaiserbacteria bacterium RIFCSPLOWO2_01_FULL_52_12b TaxID=1798509 RepID=A0A1F6EY87_9BACT|nr:MAG: hypothetical protein A3A36_00240 [Candidatus Kaiserbacteria bacterium RIFCSPLOWO2_01_FULL_52_12b]
MPDFNVIHTKNGFTIVPLKTDFEVRCDKAKEILLQWTLLQRIPADKRVQCKNKILALLSNPLQVNIEPLLTSDERSYAAKWESVLKLVRTMYGDDAAEFALKVLEVERVKN